MGFSKSSRASRTVRVLILLLILVALVLGGGYYWQKRTEQQLIAATEQILRQNYPDMTLGYSDVSVNMWTKSVAFSDLKLEREGKLIFTSQKVVFSDLESEQDTILRGKLALSGFVLPTASGRDVSGDLTFLYESDQQNSFYAIHDFRFQDRDSQSTLSWEQARVDNIARGADQRLTHFDFSANGIAYDIKDKEKAKEYAHQKIMMKFAYDFNAAESRHYIRSFNLGDTALPSVLAVSEIIAGRTDKNFAFVMRGIALPQEFNPLTTLGYQNFSLNLAMNGAQQGNFYQLRQQTLLDQGFQLDIAATMDAAFLDQPAPGQTRSYLQMLRQLVIDYRDMGLLARMYQRFSGGTAEGQAKFVQNMTASLNNFAAMFGFAADPYFTSSLDALRQFIAAPGNLRIVATPQPGVELPALTGQAMGNAAAAAKALGIVVSKF